MYESSILSEIQYLIYWTVTVFIFNVTVKTSNMFLFGEFLAGPIRGVVYQKK